MSRMQGMVAIVTGSSRGLGRAIAMQFGREGATVVASARPQSPTGLPGTPDDTAQAIESEGGTAVSIPCDVSDKEQVGALVDSVMDRYGRIDVLVNNAGIMVIGETIMEIDEARWDQSVGTNVSGPYLMCRRVVPVMMKQGRGSIINIGSRMGYDHLRGGGVLYSSTKAALHMFSLTLAEELREHNIAVNILNPGSLASEGSSVIPWAQHDWHQRVDPAVVGPSAVYLALQDASSMTGQMVARAEFGETWGLPSTGSV